MAALLRLGEIEGEPQTIKFLHGNVLEARPPGIKIVCQLVNNQARTWGGGLARASARKFPQAQHDFGRWLLAARLTERLGRVHFVQVNDSTWLASLVAQDGFGPSLVPRIRYTALQRCFEQVAERAKELSASIHMPRIGAGDSRGSWNTVEDIVRDTCVSAEIAVTVYDLPPKRLAAHAELLF